LLALCPTNLDRSNCIPFILIRYYSHTFTADEDYIRNDTELVFPNPSNGSMEACLDITIIDDMAVESNETFLVILSSSDPDVRLQNNISVITIVDAGDSKFTLHPF